MESLDSLLDSLRSACQEEKAMLNDLGNLDAQILQLTRLVSPWTLNEVG